MLEFAHPQLACHRLGWRRNHEYSQNCRAVREIFKSETECGHALSEEHVVRRRTLYPSQPGQISETEITGSGLAITQFVERVGVDWMMLGSAGFETVHVAL